MKHTDSLILLSSSQKSEWFLVRQKERSIIKVFEGYHVAHENPFEIFGVYSTLWYICCSVGLDKHFEEIKHLFDIFNQRKKGECLGKQTQFTNHSIYKPCLRNIVQQCADHNSYLFQANNHRFHRHDYIGFSQSALSNKCNSFELQKS